MNFLHMAMLACLIPIATSTCASAPYDCQPDELKVPIFRWVPVLDPTPPAPSSEILLFSRINDLPTCTVLDVVSSDEIIYPSEPDNYATFAKLYGEESKLLYDTIHSYQKRHASVTLKIKILSDPAKLQAACGITRLTPSYLPLNSHEHHLAAQTSHILLHKSMSFSDIFSAVNRMYSTVVLHALKESLTPTMNNLISVFPDWHRSWLKFEKEKRCCNSQQALVSQVNHLQKQQKDSKADCCCLL